MSEPTTPIYKKHEQIIDWISYALIVAVFLSIGTLSGGYYFNFDIFSPGTVAHELLGYRFTEFLVIFSCAFFIINFMNRVSNSLRAIAKARNSRFFSAMFYLLRNIIFSLAIIIVTYGLFHSPGGWITSSHAGITGGLGFFWLDLAVYFIAVCIVGLLVAIKDRLHRYINTTYILLFIALAYAVSSRDLLDFELNVPFVLLLFILSGGIFYMYKVHRSARK